MVDFAAYFTIQAIKIAFKNSHFTSQAIKIGFQNNTSTWKVLSLKVVHLPVVSVVSAISI